MPLIASIKTWIDNEILTATDLNSALAEIRTTTNSWAAWRDQAQTFTAAQTFAALATYQAGATVAGGVTVSSGGVAVTGNSTITGTLGGLTGLTVASGGLTVLSGGIAVAGNSSVTGVLTATTFSGSGASLTNLPSSALTGALPAISGAALTGLNAASIATGTLDEARISVLTASKLTGALPAISGANLTNLNGSNVATGTVAAARLPATLTAGTAIPELLIEQPTTTAALRFGAPGFGNPVAIQFHADHALAGSNTVSAPANYPSAFTHSQWLWVRCRLSTGQNVFLAASQFV